MSDRPIHNLICEIAGIPYKKANYVNHIMDLPSQFYGGEHRFLFHGQHIAKIKTPIGTLKLSHFGLDAKDLVELYAITKFDPDKIKAWYLHVLQDGVAHDTVRLYPKHKKR
jgi:hypothetical protein